MSVSISQTDNVGLTVESDPLALKIASNLSDLASSPTARTNLGVPYATEAQLLAATSSSTVISPSNYILAGLTTNIWSPGVTNLGGSSSGTGANVNSGVTVLKGDLIAPNALTAGYATRALAVQFPSNTITQAYNFSTVSGHSVKIYALGWNSVVTGVKMRAIWGRTSGGVPAPSTLAVKGYGWEWDFATSTLSIIAHNGTTLTTTAVTFTPVSGRSYEITAISNGAGTISLYVDGVFLGTSSGGPTGTGAGSVNWWQMEIQNEATATAQVSITYHNPKLITYNG